MGESDMEKRLMRLEEGRMIAGVCAGLAQYFGVDPTLVRIIFVILALFGLGGVVLYLILWLVMPRASDIA
jgi:phage shock protein PspC (stress-responsive transcriptional regulator)